MFFRNAGKVTTTYEQDQALFPLRMDRALILIILTVGGVVLPLLANNYWLGSILLPFLILSLAAIGLNILTGYAGQLSLGSGAFMAVGAYAAANLIMRLPGLPFPVALLLAGLVSGLICMMFGLLSLRIRGLYIVVATLAAQFMIEWICTHIPWLYMYNQSGIISTPALSWLGIEIATVPARYMTAFITVMLLTLLAKNLVRSSEGRSWIAIRDHEVAGALTGISVVRAKLSAFAVSGFFCGVSGALWSFLYLGTIDIETFTLHRSFQILFMVIIGGMGSILGAFLGAAFIVLLPVALSNLANLAGGAIRPDTLANIELMIFGGLIIAFLIIEPRGLAQLASRTRQRLRRWPLPY